MIWQHLLSENIARALCLSLAYSLWQGILLAVVVAVTLLLTKKSPAARRYSWLVGLLGLFTLSFFVTLAIELNSQHPAEQPHPGATPAVSGLLDMCLACGRDHAFVIANLWLLIIVFRSLWLLFGFFSLGRMKRTHVQSPASDWEAVLTRLAGAMSISRVVTLLESAVLKIPLTVGYLKPVILIPAGLLTGLGQQEVEMILLHELSHILRKDYLINILQRLVETLFFFNPAVLWLSARIRAEREHCVDDLVIDHTKNKTGYIRSLLHYEQYRLGVPAYAMAFGGGKGTLARMERLMSHRNQTLHKLELFGLALLLVIGIVFAGFSPPGQRQRIAKQASSPTVKQQEFEAKRKAEGEALGRHQSFQTH
jgi:bla regulator protein BlaR1